MPPLRFGPMASGRSPCPSVRPPGLNDEITAQPLSVGPHVGEPVAPLVVIVGQTDAVVGHLQPESVFPEIQLHQHPAVPCPPARGNKPAGTGEGISHADERR